MEGNAGDAEKEQAPKEEGPANPLMDIKIDGAYLEEKQREAARTMARERLLDRQFDQETFLPGQYVRFSFKPAKEFLEHDNETEPLILGGLLPGESAREYLTAKVKRHRWFPKILKSRNPLVFAVGWRRFQALPAYALEQESKTAMGVDTGLITESPPLKMLKYTPEHMHCQCVFWGYRVPAGSGLVAFQDVRARDFRICLTGVVQETAPEPKLYKKLKLVGYAREVLKRTAFIEQLFTSRLEAAAFVGAGVRTVSGIRGLVKKPEGSDGLVRCAFEDKIRKNDTVFLKTYVRCRVDQFYSPWDNHCGGDFLQIRQMNEIRHERGIPVEFNADSLYVAEKRPVFVPQELVVAPSLVRQLPFEQAKAYVDSKTGKDHLSESQRARRQIRDGTLRALVGDAEADRRA